MDLEYLVEREGRCREAVTYPRAARRAQLQRELDALPRKRMPPARRPVPGGLLDGLMLRVSAWFGRSGRLPAAPAG